MNRYQEPESAAEKLHQLYYSLAHIVLPELLQLSDQAAKHSDGTGTHPVTPSRISDPEKDEIDWTNSFKEEDGQNFFTMPGIKYTPFEGTGKETEYPETPGTADRPDNTDPSQDSDATSLPSPEDTDWMFTEEEDETDPELALLIAELEEEMNNIDLYESAEHSIGPLALDSLSDEELLEISWDRALLASDVKQAPPSDHFQLERVMRKGLEILLFRFPDPIRMPGAWRAAAVRQQGQPYRYFTLEKTAGLDETETESAILGEWTTGTIHHNYGRFKGDIWNKEDFLDAALAQYLADRK
ncbi:hypothetical protein [Rufibacter tibetensis]|uniref:Uncharacterized protein n=1 Tax=Rufibacter tibetensis TaxID=512763 RepID=A0A0P0CGB9_9BACT|nr:hypothetical protein [Rufibacter tibetensis]ALI98093.1 hypothetical protein DC20_02755 [Rufibacter tibetensis]